MPSGEDHIEGFCGDVGYGGCQAGTGALIDVEADAKASERVIEINGGERSIPVILFQDGTHLTEPSDKDLKAKLESLGII